MTASRVCSIAVLVGCAHGAATEAKAPAPQTDDPDAALVAGNTARAIELFDRACRAGDDHACAREGVYLLHGEHDAAVTARVVALWVGACDRSSDPLGCANLGTLYSDGNGVEHDPAKAAQLWDKACKGDDGWACGALANAYATGDGVATDRPRAAVLAERGCKLESASACTHQAIGLAAGWSGAPELARAAKMFRASCDQGEWGGCYQLAIALRHGQGVAKDLGESTRAFERACAAAKDLAVVREACARGPAVLDE